MLGDPKEIYFNSAGLLLWLNGVVCVETRNKSDRKICKERCANILKSRGNILMFPEGAWNVSPNQIVYHMYYGAVHMAMETNSQIVPVGVIRVGGVLDWEGKDGRLGSSGEPANAQTGLPDHVLEVYLLYVEGASFKVCSGKVDGYLVQLDHGGKPLHIDVDSLDLGVRPCNYKTFFNAENLEFISRSGLRALKKLRLEFGDPVMVYDYIDCLGSGESGNLYIVSGALVQPSFKERSLKFIVGVEHKYLDLPDLEILDLGGSGFHGFVLHADIHGKCGIGNGLRGVSCSCRRVFVT